MFCSRARIVAHSHSRCWAAVTANSTTTTTTTTTTSQQRGSAYNIPWTKKRSFAASAAKGYGGKEEDPSNESPHQQSPIIPELPNNNPDSERLQLRFGETLKLDTKNGPIVLGTDGSMKRIENWNAMNAMEQEATWRIIRKRNGERRAKLLEQEQTKSPETGQWCLMTGAMYNQV